jgi:membrane-associated PAP2 superfamily phosphatase
MTSAARNFYLAHAAAGAAAMALLVFLFEFTPLDRIVTEWFYDPAARHFPLRHDWFLEVVMHRWAKYLIVLVAVGAAVGFAASFRVAALRVHRAVFLFVFLTLATGPFLVGVLKQLSAKHCPYDLQLYGGFAPYYGLFDLSPAGVRSGECFPGGHASGGFALMSFYFVWRRRDRGLAFGALIGGFAYGFLLGFGRIAQGAHFLSHNLWSAAVLWWVMLLLHRLILYPQDFADSPAPA